MKIEMFEDIEAQKYAECKPTNPDFIGKP